MTLKTGVMADDKFSFGSQKKVKYNIIEKQ